MGRVVVKRLLQLLPIVFGLTLLLFLYTRALPGDPARTILGPRASEEAVETLRNSMGLNDPLVQQYGEYVADVARLDFGVSPVTRRSVFGDFRARFPATVELTVVAMGLAMALGVPLGRRAARKPHGPTDGTLSTMAVLGVSVPIFVLGLLLQYFFTAELKWLPAVGRIDPALDPDRITNFLLVDTLLAKDLSAFWNAVQHLILPALTLATVPLAYILRMTRASVIEVSNEDYLRTARAKGLSRRRINRWHVMRNAWLPVITIAGVQFGTLLGGAVLTETIFGWGGVGSWLVNAIRARDYITIQSGIIIIAIVFTLVNLVVDLSYYYFDPRTREEAAT